MGGRNELRATPTCEPGCPCGDVTLCGTVDPALLSTCPKCGALVEDLDGFGVLAHDACGYCSCPSIDGDTCSICGKTADDGYAKDGFEV